jgi:hypothetical protein
MMNGVLSVVLRVAALVAAVGALAPALNAAPLFTAAYRSNSEAWLIDDVGKAIYRQAGDQPPQVAVPLRNLQKSAFVWRHRPCGLVRFRSDWLIADGTRMLYMFDSSGVFKRRLTLPAPSFDVFATGDEQIFVYDSHPGPDGGRLWSSSDLMTFRAVPFRIHREGMTRRERLLTIHLAFAAGNRTFYFVPGIGEAVATKVAVGTWKVSLFQLAYRRSRERVLALKTLASTDLEAYPAAARDLVLLPSGELLVLRNREDVRNDRNTMTVRQGQRVDRYSGDGSHVATASLPKTCRWILAATTTELRALGADGTIVTASFRQPEAGGITE